MLSLPSSAQPSSTFTEPALKFGIWVSLPPPSDVFITTPDLHFRVFILCRQPWLLIHFHNTCWRLISACSAEEETGAQKSWVADLEWTHCLSDRVNQDQSFLKNSSLLAKCCPALERLISPFWSLGGTQSASPSLFSSSGKPAHHNLAAVSKEPASGFAKAGQGLRIKRHYPGASVPCGRIWWRDWGVHLSPPCPKLMGLLPSVASGHSYAAEKGHHRMT